MPWKVINKMNLKNQLITDYTDNHLNITELSQKYGISRPTVYKWITRYNKLGLAGLNDHNRAPHHRPNKTPQNILNLIVNEKLKNRKRGPRKIRAQLYRQHPNLQLPAISTISYWLKKEGLVESRKRRYRVPPYSQPFSECLEPNDVWSIDYKGQFYMQNKLRCYPFTITDNFSRFILGCKALRSPCYLSTKDYLESIFREYGLPFAIRNDNGTPFAGKCLGGLSRLSIWFILLGIIPERIQKGCPQQNGRHERMHRSLKHDVLDNAAKNLKEQQKIFDSYKYDFNNNRPHESLGDSTPNYYYQKSYRPFIENPHHPTYDYSYIVRHVHSNRGDFKFKGRRFFLSKILCGLPIGLKEIADDIWQIKLSFYTLGSVDLRKNVLINN